MRSENCERNNLIEQSKYMEWRGSEDLIYNIDFETYYTDVKSMIVRNKNQVTLSNLF